MVLPQFAAAQAARVTSPSCRDSNASTVCVIGGTGRSFDGFRTAKYAIHLLNRGGHMARKAKKRKITKIKVIDLKRQKSAASLKKTLQQASKRKVAIIVLNAPFKLAA
jgi:hypothetical protein